MIVAEGLVCRIGRWPVLSGIDLAVARGEILGLLGENGAGKSTLLRCLGRLRRPCAGRVLVDGSDPWRMSARDSAKLIAILLQDLPDVLELTAREVVALGRLARAGAMSSLSGAADHVAADEALRRVKAAGLAERPFDQLSGGERQRVMLARALAQAPAVLLLDEPLNHLDVRHQLETLALIRDTGLTVVAALHDLNLAAAFCDRLAVLQEGRLVAVGPPAEILAPGLIERAFAVAAAIDRHPFHGGARVTFSHALQLVPKRSTA